MLNNEDNKIVTSTENKDSKISPMMTFIMMIMMTGVLSVEFESFCVRLDMLPSFCFFLLILILFNISFVFIKL